MPATLTRVPCPRGCGTKFVVQAVKAEALHECPNNQKGVRYADGKPLLIGVVVGGPEADLGTEVWAEAKS